MQMQYSKPCRGLPNLWKNRLQETLPEWNLVVVGCWMLDGAVTDEDPVHDTHRRMISRSLGGKCEAEQGCLSWTEHQTRRPATI